MAKQIINGIAYSTRKMPFWSKSTRTFTENLYKKLMKLFESVLMKIVGIYRGYL